ncbi:MAG TPA: hypothetical protein VFM25_12645 [Verrucomicrobiae bacterium]|nr:hypothetical protein [Verrucomicrobiae bacterium]
MDFNAPGCVIAERGGVAGVYSSSREFRLYLYCRQDLTHDKARIHLQAEGHDQEWKKVVDLFFGGVVCCCVLQHSVGRDYGSREAVRLDSGFIRRSFFWISTWLHSSDGLDFQAAAKTVWNAMSELRQTACGDY